MKLIYSKFASQNILSERHGTSHIKLEESGTCWKQLQASGTKKSLLLCGLPKALIGIQWFWKALIFIKNKALL